MQRLEEFSQFLVFQQGCLEELLVHGVGCKPHQLAKWKVSFSVGWTIDVLGCLFIVVLCVEQEPVQIIATYHNDSLAVCDILDVARFVLVVSKFGWTGKLPDGRVDFVTVGLV